MHILILNGPNLGHIGTREPEIYGKTFFEDYYETLTTAYPDVVFSYKQSNSEGVLIDYLHECLSGEVDGVVFNAGAYTHYSIALCDAIRMLSIPVIEVHLSNIAARESFRQISVIASACLGVISGFGLESYRLAVEALMKNQMEE